MMTQTPIASRIKYSYGEVTCLNCGRPLAAAVRRLSDLATMIRPFQPGQEIAVEICAGNRLRCKRCGGRAFMEFDDRPVRHSESLPEMEPEPDALVA